MASKGKAEGGKNMPFWVVKFKDNDGKFVEGDGFMGGYESEEEAREFVDRLYHGCCYRGVVVVVPKPKERRE